MSPGKWRQRAAFHSFSGWKAVALRGTLTSCTSCVQVGAARFIRTLVSRATDDIRPHAPALIKALTSQCRAERSPAIRKAYAGACAQVLR